MKLSVKLKIFIAFLIVSTLFCSASFYSFTSMKKTNESYDYLFSTVSELEMVTQSIQTEMAQQISNYRAYMLYENQEYRDLLNKSHSAINNLIKEGKEIATLQETKDRLDAIASQNKEFKQTTDSIMDLLQTDKQVAVERGLNEIPPIVTNVEKEVESLHTWLRDTIMVPKVEETQKDAISSAINAILISLAATLFAMIIGYFLARMIIPPLVTVVKQMKAISSGDLTGEPLEIKSKDEISELLKSSNDMADSMRSILKEINMVSEKVSSHSEELTQSANEIVLGTEQTASTMEQLAESAEMQAVRAMGLSSVMISFAQSLEDTSERGEYIQRTSSEVLRKTMEGSQLMQSSTQQMKKIDGIVKDSVQNLKDLDEKSKEISKLVVVIKDIAEQTNLLALNAAIEAARAGEHGKGFAVVADEVRKLAEQVGISVSHITGIVANIQKGFGVVNHSLHAGYKEVEIGTDQIQATSQTFNEIHETISDMANKINIISDNLGEISRSSQEMNKSIEDIASTAEESAAGVEQTSATVQQTNSAMHEVGNSSNELAEMAEKLNKLIHQFKI